MKFFLLILISISLFALNLEVSLENKKDLNITNWVVSEKLDGVRAYWDGKKLYSRSGKIINVPSFFIKNFPKFELDGELWSKREDFQNIVSIIKSEKNRKRWKNLTYNIFELPNAKGNFFDRLNKLKLFLEKNPNNYLKIIEQIQIKEREELNKIFKEFVLKGAEGVMVKNPYSKYEAGKSKNIFKLKPFYDDEAEIIGYREGKGKYRGKVGSLYVKFRNKTFYVGSGLKDKDRENPPKIGEIITFKYNGFTKKGIPRFPVFLRVRSDYNLSFGDN